jgi:hypothetical protein
MLRRFKNVSDALVGELGGQVRGRPIAAGKSVDHGVAVHIAFSQNADLNAAIIRDFWSGLFVRV